METPHNFLNFIISKIKIMKKILLTAMPLAFFAMLALNPVADPLPLGSSIPKADIKMKNTDGKEVSFNDAKGKNGLLVMFSCNTCPVVIKNQSRTIEVCKYAMDKRIGVIVLNSNEANRDGADSFEEMKGYAKEQNYSWNYAVDNNSAMADAFGANRTPECFLFDKNEKLIYHGAIDDNPNNAGSVNRRHLMTAMDETLAGKEISQKQSRSVGCSIKRLGN
jgi:cytochrome oxidase Cu insertion factor (SCO1/SenC/PrrC family)